MAVVIQPFEPFVFVGNPFVLRAKCAASDLTSGTMLQLNVMVAGKTVTLPLLMRYNSDSGKYECAQDIAPFIADLAQYATVADGANGLLFDKAHYVKLTIGSNYTWLMPGAINYRLQHGGGVASRFYRADDGQQSGSVRSSGLDLTFYKSELRGYSLPFISPNPWAVLGNNTTTWFAMSLIYEQNTGATVPLNNAPESCALAHLANFKRSELKFYKKYDGPQPVYSLAARVHIVDDPEAEQKYLFTFRNSYGYMENVLLFGARENAYTYEGEKYKRYDEITGDYIPATARRVVVNKITVYTGALTAQRANLVRDLLQSNEVYLYNGDCKTPCVVSGSFAAPVDAVQPYQLPITADFGGDITIEESFDVEDYSVVGDRDLTPIVTVEDEYINAD